MATYSSPHYVVIITACEEYYVIFAQPPHPLFNTPRVYPIITISQHSKMMAFRANFLDKDPLLAFPRFLSIIFQNGLHHNLMGLSIFRPVYTNKLVLGVGLYAILWLVLSATLHFNERCLGVKVKAFF